MGIFNSTKKALTRREFDFLNARPHTIKHPRSRYKYQSLWFGFALCFVPYASAPASSKSAPPPSPVMAIQGQGSVTAVGAFSYNIPIQVPPGTAHMGPHISLSYISSDSSDGIMGIGWTLNGFSAVSRCPQTLAQDGTHGGVNYDSNDRFCLDGQRLILITEGVAYGSDGSEYRTEIDSFSRIIAHGNYGNSGNGPAWFEIHTKDGHYYQYGNNGNSQVLSADRTAVRLWAVNNVSDVKGNYMTFTYFNSGSEYYPTRVDYTANDGAGLNTYNTVTFNYVQRSSVDQGKDLVPMYQAGTLIEPTVLLTDINTTAHGTSVYHYILSYNYATSGASHDALSSITLCNGADASCSAPCNDPNNCLATTTFGWEGTTDQVNYYSVHSTSLAQGDLLAAGDFNGDGVTDAFVHGTSCPSEGEIYLGDGDGTSFSSGDMTATYDYWTSGNTNPDHYSGPACFQKAASQQSYLQYFIGNMDGTGLSDFVLSVAQTTQQGYGYTEPSIESLQNNGSNGLNQITKDGSMTNVPLQLGQYGATGDYNGDGLTDFFTLTGNTSYAYLAETGQNVGYFAPDSGHSGFGTNFLANSVFSGDFDGDGCTDVLAQGNLNAIMYFCQPKKASISIPDWIASSGTLVIGDFNGDGKSDVLLVPYNAAPVIYLSTGDGLDSGHTVTASNASNWWKYQIAVGDWNGDGKTDIALIAGGIFAYSDNHQLFLSTGTNFISGQTITNDCTSTAYEQTAVAADWNNDGVTDLWIQDFCQDEEAISYSSADSHYIPQLMTQVSNGLGANSGPGATTTVTYETLSSNGAFYKKASNASYPTQDFDGPLYVVSSVTTSGSGSTVEETYTYTGLKKDLQGRGLLAFTSISATDPATNVTQITTYNTAFPLTGQIASQLVTYKSATLKSVNYYYEWIRLAGVNSSEYFVGLCQTQAVTNDLDGSALPNSSTTYTYDFDGTSQPCQGTGTSGYGNITQSQVTTSLGGAADVRTVMTTNSWQNNAANWILGQLTQTVINSVLTASGNTISNITRTTSYSPNYNTGLVASAIVQPGTSNPQDTMEIDLNYDTFGNVADSVGVSSIPAVTAKACIWNSGTCTTTSRTTHIMYDSYGQFPTTTSNPLNQSESWTFDNRFGEPASHTDVNNLTTSWQYDWYGHEALEARPDGTETKIATVYCPGVNHATTGWCPSDGSAYYVWTDPLAADGTTNVAPTTTANYDDLSRETSATTASFDNVGWIYTTQIQYDSQGRISQVAQPHRNSDTTYWTINTTIDALGRPTVVTNPDTTQTNYAYHGPKTSVTNANNETTTDFTNAEGLIASVVDANSGTTLYAYDAFGDLLSSTDSASNTTNYGYDVLGRKVSMTDPDLGAWSYVYDGFSELAQQTDPNETLRAQSSTSMAYDALGRMIARIEPDMNSKWIYDTSTYGVGMLGFEQCGPGVAGNACKGNVVNNGFTYTRTYSYDSLSRPDQITDAWDNQNYYDQLTYNSNTGQVSTVRAFSGFTVSYNYDPSTGYLDSVNDFYSNNSYWTINERDAWMHLQQGTAGNGVITQQVFDPKMGRLAQICVYVGSQCGPDLTAFSYSYDNIGNVTQRSDSYQGTTDTFCYDALNRLTAYALNTSGSCPEIGGTTVAYDTGYAPGDIVSKSDIGTYQYPQSGENSKRPHAVSSIQTCSGCKVNGVTNPVFQYDADGNMIIGAARLLSYTSFNKTSHISQGNNNFAFLYDPDHNRAAYTQTVGGGTTTDYMNDPVAGVVSERFSGGPTWTWRTYLIVDGEIVAERITPSTLNSTVTMNYFVNDDLGSAAYLTSSTGQLLTGGYLSYDAWGKARNPNGSADTTCSLPKQSPTTRGYTGQEQLIYLCPIINLNARLYDPSIGRFLSADSTVPDQYNGQSLNRYSYVDNRPMFATDPSGMDYCYDYGSPCVQVDVFLGDDFGYYTSDFTDPFFDFSDPFGYGSPIDYNGGLDNPFAAPDDSPNDGLSFSLAGTSGSIGLEPIDLNSQTSPDCTPAPPAIDCTVVIGSLLSQAIGPSPLGTIKLNLNEVPVTFTGGAGATGLDSNDKTKPNPCSPSAVQNAQQNAKSANEASKLTAALSVGAYVASAAATVTGNPEIGAPLFSFARASGGVSVTLIGWQMINNIIVWYQTGSSRAAKSSAAGLAVALAFGGAQSEAAPPLAAATGNAVQAYADASHKGQQAICPSP